MYRIGHGFDVHVFTESRRLVLGGVEVDHPKGLRGHSDADVVLHALCNALLGAVGEGDIGELFPPDDPLYKDISSIKLVEKVMVQVERNRFRISNVDISIITEKPRLKPYKGGIRKNIASILGIDKRLVNVKAGTMEGMDSIGEEKGMAAHAVVLLRSVSDN